MKRVLTAIDSAPSNSLAPLRRPVSGAWSDGLGMVASIGCAVHCAAMPFAIAYLPALGLSFLADEAFHQWMAVGCFAIAVTAFVPGFRKHRCLSPVIIGSIGLAMISIAAFGFAGECCVACESGAPPVAFADTEPGTDACCPHCASESLAESVSGASDSPNNLVAASAIAPPWLGFVLPWLTPLGGFVLVSAHLLNRRECGCCCSEVAEDGLPGDSSAV